MTSLCDAIDAQRDLLAPATDAEVRSACKVLLMHADGTRLTAPTPESLFAVWRAHCREMPGSLLAECLPKVLREWTNDFHLPQPGEVWEAVDAKLARMRTDLAKLEQARWATREELPDPAERKPSAETDAVIAETMRKLRAAGQTRRGRT